MSAGPWASSASRAYAAPERGGDWDPILPPAGEMVDGMTGVARIEDRPERPSEAYGPSPRFAAGGGRPSRMRNSFEGVSEEGDDGHNRRYY